MKDQRPIALELQGISKRFGTVPANQSISLSVKQGTIHAIVGENGAGKSTLMNIIYGLLQPDEGLMFIHGSKTRFESPKDSIEAGIGMVHQHFKLIPTLSVAENIILGYEPKSGGFRLPMNDVESEIKTLSETHSLAIDPSALISSLSVGLEQRVEILKVLYRNAEILILDEPTAVLTPIETEELFKTLRSLKENGKTIILITHKLEEVLAVSDEVSVMHQGELIETMPTKEATKPLLAKLMVGRDVLLRVEKSEAQSGECILEIADVTLTTAKGIQILNRLSFNVYAGEIYGLCGVEGNGQTSLLNLLWGLEDVNTQVEGQVKIENTSLLGKSPLDIANLGVSHIPEDRYKTAMITDYSISENLIFGRHHEPKFLQPFGFNQEHVRAFTHEMINTYDIRTSDTEPEQTPIGSLSGGNQQKVIVARELSRPGLKLLILAQPTRGVDIGAIEFIHKQIISARDRGVAILLISSELEEILSLSDRIGCLFKGSLTHEFSKTQLHEGLSDPEPFKKEIGTYIT